MSPRLVIAIVTTLVYELALMALVLWGLPRLGIYIPAPGLAVLMLGLGVWAIVTYRKGTQALDKKVEPGFTTMIGSRAVVVKALKPAGVVKVKRGMVKIKGELWEARTSGEEVRPGEEVIVVGQEGLKLMVRRIEGNRSKLIG